MDLLDHPLIVDTCSLVISQKRHLPGELEIEVIYGVHHEVDIGQIVLWSQLDRYHIDKQEKVFFAFEIC